MLGRFTFRPQSIPLEIHWRSVSLVIEARLSKRRARKLDFLRFTALLLGFGGVATYLLLWLAVRAFGSVTLSFGIWGPEWVNWMENWVEPAILVSWLAIIGWAVRHELRQAASKAKSR